MGSLDKQIRNQTQQRELLLGMLIGDEHSTPQDMQTLLGRRISRLLHSEAETTEY